MVWIKICQTIITITIDMLGTVLNASHNPLNQSPQEPCKTEMRIHKNMYWGEHDGGKEEQKSIKNQTGCNVLFQLFEALGSIKEVPQLAHALLFFSIFFLCLILHILLPHLQVYCFFSTSNLSLINHICLFFSPEILLFLSRILEFPFCSFLFYLPCLWLTYSYFFLPS